MLVKNTAKRAVQHTYFNKNNELIVVEIQGGEVKDIEDKIAEIWLKHGLVTEYVEPKRAKEEKEELLAKIAKLEAENKALKKEEPKEEAKETKTKAKTTTKKGK